MNPQSKTAWRWESDRFVVCDSVPVTDRGFRYGMSVFESLPVRGRIPYFLAGHYERLRQACLLSGLEVGLPEFDALDALLRGIEFDGYARIYVTAGEGNIFADTGEGSVLVFVEPRDFAQASKPDGYRLAGHKEPHSPMFGGLKTANYWMNLLALQAARKLECDEALLFNNSGELISASMANVFVVQGGKIKTPAARCGARAGVVREWVMGRREVEECSLREDDLTTVDEIFLTNSWIGVMPVVSYDGRILGSKDLALELRVEYGARIAEGW
ncbi:MAG: aminotransferase class IV [Chthoniobacteraceae bacterium]